MRRARKARPAARGAGKRNGYTMLDLAIGIMIVVVSIGAISSSLTSGFSLNRVNRETAVATEAAEAVIERIRAAAFDETFARFNEDQADDPPGVSSPGAAFDVVGLTAQDGDPDGRVGEIFFPGDGFELREDFVDDDLGMPRDLNGDGTSGDALDHGDDYVYLPVRVRVAWRGAGGDREIELVTVVTQR